MTGAPRRPGRAWLLIALACTLAGLLGCGAWLGHLLWPVEQVTLAEVPPSTEAATPTATTGTMPDVLGLTEAFARRAVQDAGVAGQITVVTRQAAGEAGRVVDQVPAPGAPDAAVRLTVSAPARVPATTGRSVTAVRAELERLGATVETKRVVAPGVDAGNVVATRPAAGAALPSTVELDVSDPGDPLPLTDLHAVTESGCSTRDGVRIGATQTTHALSCTPSEYTPVAAYDVDLARRADALKATIGLDNAGTPGTATVTVRGDGRVLATKTLTFGTEEPLFVTVTGVVRLRIDVTSAAKEAPTVVLGDPVLLGQADALAGLTS